MKLLKLIKDGREIETMVLHRPVHLIGRSPHCDMILRAKGIKPVHFIVEWIGSGDFDENAGDWTIFDASSSPDPEDLVGVVVGAKPTLLAGIEFLITEAPRLESLPQTGGAFSKAMLAAPKNKIDPKSLRCLEYVQVHEPTGSLEQVLHYSFSDVENKKSLVLCSDIPELKVNWSVNESGANNIRFDSDPRLDAASKFYLGASEKVDRDKVVISTFETVQVHHGTHKIYLRLVSEGAKVQIPHVVFDDSQTKKIFQWIFIPLIALMILLLTIETPKRIPNEELAEPTRIVNIEVVAPPPPPAPVAAPAVEQPAAPEGASAQANQSKAPPPPKTPQTAPKKNVGQMGVLGILAQSRRGGANKVSSADIVASTTPNAARPQVVLESGASGVLDDRGDANSKRQDSLSSAATKLSGGDSQLQANAVQSGAPGGSRANLSGVGAGSSSGSGGVNALGIGGVTIQGGLDRETVRRIVRSKQTQLQTCYEKALLARPRLSGRYIFDWNILAEGQVGRVEQTKQEGTAAPDFSDCLRTVIQGMVFPKAPNGQPTRVVYPFEFRSRE